MKLQMGCSTATQPSFVSTKKAANCICGDGKACINIAHASYCIRHQTFGINTSDSKATNREWSRKVKPVDTKHSRTRQREQEGQWTQPNERRAGTMVTEGEPAAFVKVMHLMIMSFSWGMQLWTTFISGFVLFRGVSRHTFGLVQSKLFPYYFYSVLGCSFLNLSIYAAYHPRELLSSSESCQIFLFFLSLILAAINAQWFVQSTTKTMLKLQVIEREHGLGDEVGRHTKQEAYKVLREKDPKYQALRRKFFRYHGLSSLFNLACVVCTGVNLAYAGLQLSGL